MIWIKVKNVNNIPYIRILAFNDKGREIIKNIKTNSDINIINKFSKYFIFNRWWGIQNIN